MISQLFYYRYVIFFFGVQHTYMRKLKKKLNRANICGMHAINTVTNTEC